MKHIIAVVALWAVSILTGLTFQTYAQDDCSQLLPPNYYYSGEGYVLPTVTSTLNIRAEPSSESALLGTLKAGDRFSVLVPETTCAGGYHWVNVSFNGVTGWVAESFEQQYWLGVYDLREFYGYNAGTEHIHFSYPPQVGASDIANLYPANDVDVVPEYVEIVLESYDYTVNTWQATGARVYIYPTVTMKPGGFVDFSAAPARLQSVLDNAAQSVSAETVPVLPGFNVPQILAEQATSLDFQNGRGVRLIVVQSFSADPITRDNLMVAYQGLTNDGSYYVSALVPVDLETLPPVPENFYNQDVAQIDAYYAEVRSAVANATPDQFSPRLDELDTMFASFMIESPLATVVSPGSGTAVFSAEGITFEYDAALISRIEVRTEEAYIEEEPGMSMYGSTPGSTYLNLFGWPVDNAGWSARIKIFPVSEYMPDTIFDTMRLALAEVFATNAELAPIIPADDGFTETFPIAEPINAAQMFAVQPAYIELQGGRGMRFISMYSQAPLPVTNNDLTYLFSGLTSDGAHVIFATLPVRASSLPDDYDFSTMENVDFEALITQNRALIEGLQALSGDQFMPTLSQLDIIVGSIRIE